MWESHKKIDDWLERTKWVEEDARMAAEGIEHERLTQLVGENAISLAGAEIAYSIYRGQLIKAGVILDTQVVSTDLV